eukprot:2269326-Pyramimonas_sp.AAC.1
MVTHGVSAVFSIVLLGFLRARRGSCVSRANAPRKLLRSASTLSEKLHWSLYLLRGWRSSRGCIIMCAIEYYEHLGSFFNAVTLEFARPAYLLERMQSLQTQMLDSEA